MTIKIFYDSLVKANKEVVLDIVDMHCHSKISDGSYTPAELAQLAGLFSLKGLVLTDHDTYQGCEEFIQESKRCGLKTVSGIEVSALYRDRSVVHILIYRLEDLIRNVEFNQILEALCQNQNIRTNEFIKKINHSFGLSLSFERLKAEFNSIGPFVHYTEVVAAAAKIRTQYFTQMKEFCKQEGIWKTPNNLDLFPYATDAIKLAHKNGALTFWAHPCDNSSVKKRKTLTAKKSFIHKVLNEFTVNGLSGIEIFHHKHSNEKIAMLKEIAKENNILFSGGSDFHGQILPNIKLGHHGIPEELFDGIFK